MLLTGTSTGPSRTIRRAVIAGASLAVIAAFVAAPTADAAPTASNSGSHGHHLPAPPAFVPSAPHHHVVVHHHAPPKADRSAAAKRAFGLAKPATVKVHLKRPARGKKPEKIVRKHVALWRGKPSYTLGKNTRLRPDIISGISASCEIAAGSTHSGTWSPSTCPNGYEVNGDVTVPVGKTLTIKADTVVYFDTTSEGALGTLDPSVLPDLIVDGTLTVAGTAAEPVLLTSANAAPSSTVSPEPGDWGYVFFNHTGANKGTGSLTDLHDQYGEGIAADKSAPPIVSSTISQVAAGQTVAEIASSIDRGAGIDYSDVPGGTVTFTNDTFNGAQDAGIAVESDWDHTDFSGANSTGHAFTLSVTGSHITGGAPTGLNDSLYADSETNGTSSSTNNAGVTLDVHNNHIVQTDDGYELEIDARSNPGAIAGTAAITGVFRNNVLTGGPSSYGVSFEATTEDSTASGTASCDKASACVIVPFIGNHISAERSTVGIDTTVQDGPGSSVSSTPYGGIGKKKVKKTVTVKVKVRVKCPKGSSKHKKCYKTKTEKKKKTVVESYDISGGTYQANDSEGFEYDTESEGSGAATTSAPMVDTVIQASDEDINSDVIADFGTATNSWPTQDSTLTSYDANNFDVSTNGSRNGVPSSGSTGGASTVISDANGTWVSSDSNIANDETAAHYGPAKSTVTLTDASLASGSSSNVEGVTNASVDGGSGSATGSVAVRKSTLSADGGSISNDVNAANGAAAATATTTVTGSELDAFSGASVDNEANASESAGSHGNADVTTTLTDDKVQANGYGINAEAQSLHGGSATSSPKISGSSLTIADDDAIYNNVSASSDSGTGAATGSPSISGGSVIDADENVIDNSVSDSYGSGVATGSPTITNSTVNATTGSVIDNQVNGTNQSGSTGSAVGTPVISGGSAVAEGYLINNDVTADYAGASGSPRETNITGVSGESYALYNSVSADGDAGGSAATGSPSISGSTLHAPQGILTNSVFSYGGAATGSPSISKSTAVATDAGAIYNNVYADDSHNSGSTATGNPTISGSTVTATSSDITNQVFGEQGPAIGSPVVTGSALTATSQGAINNTVDASNAGHTGSATANPKISSSTVTAEDQALMSLAFGEHGASVASPVITSSPLKSFNEGVITNDAYGSNAGGTGAGTADLKLTSSPVTCAACSDNDAVYNYAASTTGAATASPTFASSPLRNPDGYGLYNQALSAQSSGSGAATAEPVLTSSAIDAYDSGVYNVARGSSGNSSANGSTTITGSRVHSSSGTALDLEARGSGSGASTVDPTIKGVDIRSSQDDGIDLTSEGSGSGASVVGGHITGSTVVARERAIDVDASPSGTGGASTFDTALTDDAITSVDDAAIVTTDATIGASLTLDPTITDGSITAAGDYGINLVANGYAGSSSGALKVAPVISSVPIISGRGVNLIALDTRGSASPGQDIVGGSITSSSIVANQGTGVDAAATCQYCQGGAKVSTTVINTPIDARSTAGYFDADVAGTSTASAVVGGSATSTKGSTWTGTDDYGIDVEAEANDGSATNAFKVNGLHLSGEAGDIVNYDTAENGVASNSSTLTNNVLDNQKSSSEYAIFDDTDSTGAHTAARAGSISGNTISDVVGSDSAVYSDVSAGGQPLPTLRVEDNSVTNVGSIGFDIEAHGSTPAPGTDKVTIEHNTIDRTGNLGLYAIGFTPVITDNIISHAGTAGGDSDSQDGVYVSLTPAQGSLTCNDIWGNGIGVEYGNTNPTSGAGGHNGDPVTTDNSFVDPKSSTRNSIDLKSENPGTGTTDAASNFWGGTPRLYAPTSHYDVSPKLKKPAKCTATAGA